MAGRQHARAWGAAERRLVVARVLPVSFHVTIATIWTEPVRHWPKGVPPGVPKSYRALADHGNVPRSTLHHRARGRRSREEKAQSQHYLKPYEEDVVVKFLLQMSDLGQPVRIKFIPSIAFNVTRQRPAADRPLKPPGRNWAKALEIRHP